MISFGKNDQYMQIGVWEIRCCNYCDLAIFELCFCNFRITERHYSLRITLKEMKNDLIIFIIKRITTEDCPCFVVGMVMIFMFCSCGSIVTLAFETNIENI